MVRFSVKSISIILIVLLLLTGLGSAITPEQIGIPYNGPSGTGNGTAGAPGAPGAPGSNGTNGTAATIVINNTVTGAAGSSANVTNIGTITAAIFDFVIPQGLQGIQGIQGLTGSTGATGPMNQTPNMTAGPTGATGAAGPNNDGWYLWVNGTRAMTGNLSMGSYYITGLISGSSGGSVVNKTYIDAGDADAAPGSTTQVLYNFGGKEAGNSTFTFDNTTLTAPVFAGDGSGLTGIGSTAATALTFDVKAGEILKKGQPVYLSGASGANPIVNNADNTITARTRVVGLVTTDLANNGQGQVRRAGTLSAVNTAGTTALNPLGQNWNAGDLLFLEQSGGLTNVRPTSGRSVKCAYTLKGSNAADTLLVYPFENPVWITGAAAEDVVTRVGDSVGVNKLSIRNYTNSEVAYVNSYGLASFNGTNELANITMNNHYITGLLSGSSGGSVVNKTYVDTFASYNSSYLTSTYNATYDAKTNYNASYITSTYNATYDAKSNYNASYITSTYNSTYDSKPSSTYNATYDSKPSSTYNSTYDAKPSSTYNATYDAKAPTAVFGYITLMAGSGMVTTTNPGTMNQWETTTNKNNFIYWNFTDGGTETVQWIVDFPADWNSTANVIFTPIWTAQDGSGTVNFTVSAKLFPNDAAMDTALATVGTSIDTLITVGDMHVSPDTTGAAITSVSSGGNTAIVKVARDSANDTLSGTAQLLGLRIKYARILA
jgi:hypothetical protein